MMSSSRLYETALLGPLADQLVDAAGIRPRMRVLDVGARHGVLTRRLVSAVGPAGGVVAVEATQVAAAVLRAELRASRVEASVVVVASTAALPFGPGEFDIALSLLPSADDGGVLEAMQRAARAAAVMLSDAAGPTPQTLLARAWDEVTGSVPEALNPQPVPRVPAGWDVAHVTDVVRFDGSQQLWQALLEHVGNHASSDMHAGIERRFGQLLAPHEGFDGTLRIPVQMTLARWRGLPHSR